MVKILTLSMKPTGCLLTIFRSVNENNYAQITNVYRPPVPLGPIQKNYPGKKLFKCGLKLFIERLHLTLDYIILNVAEKYQKHELVQHLCRIPRPKLANQHCISQFFLGLQFCVDFRTSAVNEHA